MDDRHTDLHPDQHSAETHRPSVGVQPPATSQRRRETHVDHAGGTLLHPDHTAGDTQSADVGVQPPATSQTTAETHPGFAGGTSAWHELALWADMLHDTQESRKAQANRISPNKAHGLGHVDPDMYAHVIKSFEATEKLCSKALVATFRRTAPPAVVDWVKNTHGLGEPSMARFLGHLGHPVWATPYHWEGVGSNRVLVADEPYRRTVGQLWQYCGHGAPARRRKGMTAVELAAQGSPNLKSRLWNVSVGCVKASGGMYRDVYDEAKDATVGKVHNADCPPCHAKEGDPWRDGHRHAHAVRMIGKAILRDLWILSQ